MRKKTPVPYSQKFLYADPLALRLLERMLAFDPKDRPSAEEVVVSNVEDFVFVLSTEASLGSDYLTHALVIFFQGAG